MVPAGQFTVYDLRTIGRAATLAERLTTDYFGLPGDEWVRKPYGMQTLKETDPTLYEEEVFAQVILYKYRRAAGHSQSSRPKKDFGIILQDPHILRALLRSGPQDLWTLALYILTHELIHIVRFRYHEAEFFSPNDKRDGEERLVHGITREILAGCPNTEPVLRLYESDIPIPKESYSPLHGGEFHAHL